MLLPQGKSCLTTSREILYSNTSMPAFFLYVQSFPWARFQRLDPCCARVEVRFAALPFSLYYRMLRVCQGWGRPLVCAVHTAPSARGTMCNRNIAKRSVEITDFLLLKACA